MGRAGHRAGGRHRRGARPRAAVSKLLSQLAAAGLVTGQAGRGGGFRLARPPGEITLRNVFDLFERTAERTMFCPFGDGLCGSDDPCPLHDRLIAVHAAMDEMLETTTFEAFRARGA
ncbi:MAG: Rrf2 family transcriptional regulator [Planctomycetes bacterium]|nr:Rrf2 family transcriptional regulator [Planctomycetota bacterium]